LVSFFKKVFNKQLGNLRHAATLFLNSFDSNRRTTRRLATNIPIGQSTTNKGRALRQAISEIGPSIQAAMGERHPSWTCETEFVFQEEGRRQEGWPLNEAYLNVGDPTNPVSQPHHDMQDDYSSILVAFPKAGKKERFCGGSLSFSDLGIVVDVEPGDFLYFNAKRLEHSNTPITEGTRLSLVFSTHTHYVNDRIRRLSGEEPKAIEEVVTTET
jgi:hypothetical protein